MSPMKLKPGDPFGITLGALTIWLDSTRFRDAAALLHVRGFRYAVDSDSVMVEFVACGHTSQPNAQYIVLHTHPSDTNHVLSVELDPDPPVEDSIRAHCIELPMKGTEVGTTIFGLRPGARRQEIEQSTGAPSERAVPVMYVPTDTIVRYVLASDVDGDIMPMDTPGDHRVILIITYRRGVAQWFSVDRNNEYRDGGPRG